MLNDETSEAVSEDDVLYHCCHLKVSMEDSGGTPEGNPALVDEPDDSFEPGSYGLTRGVLADVISPALWDRIEAEISQFFTVNGVEPLPWKSIVWEGWQELLDATLLTPADCHHDLLQGVLVRFFRVLFDNERVRLRTDEDQRNTTTTLPALPPVLPLPPLRCLPSPSPGRKWRSSYARRSISGTGRLTGPTIA